MQRKPSKSTRGINPAERRFAGWVKEQPCIVCGNENGSIVDHIEGSAFKCRDGVASVLVGMWYLLPLCQVCDKVKTNQSKRAFETQFGKSLGYYWLKLMCAYKDVHLVPGSVRRALLRHILGEFVSESDAAEVLLSELSDV